jgi:hypothetical protein
MNQLFATLNEHPRIVALTGTLAGWFSAEKLERAVSVAQFGAAIVAGLVSVCALILTAPKAIAEVNRWFRKNP